MSGRRKSLRVRVRTTRIGTGGESYRLAAIAEADASHQYGLHAIKGTGNGKAEIGKGTGKGKGKDGK